ncbi:zinc-binding dehydrogenase [Oxalobacter vibrioformis]|uniref:Zinc-binding dehydrogenase n=1 Tax=Oxalobacter vibrioformis TaxID=933080 RepID=A0A9E9LZC8_9BURK|nr:zinc-binding dehydrogenase [Oxalobacter vibrioformis]WAW10023.1 zinc-binding dehydrogenase [Oxalobacter vibrioformis]
MKTEAWCWHEKGEPTDLILESVELGNLAADEVLVENRIISLNPVDWKLIEWGHPEWKDRHIPGVDGMGIITALGENVCHLEKGMRVCYHADLTRNGSFSRHIRMKANTLMRVPDNCSDEDAAAFPCPSLTAWQAFQKTPSLKGKNVLVNSAGGSVGYFLTQLLLKEGAHLVVTASEKHHEHLIRLGVQHAVDYRDPDWLHNLGEIRPAGFHAAFDMVSGEAATQLAGLLDYYGHLVAVQDRVEKNPVAPFTTCISLHEIALGAFHRFVNPEQVHELMSTGERLLHAVGQGEYLLREQTADVFENLPQHLAKMKKARHDLKYLIRVSH